MPRLHFPDQALVRRLVEAAVTSGKPLMLAHDHGVYLCTDAMKEPDGTCVCAFVKGCDPRQNDAAFEVAHHLVGYDDFGISFPMGGQEQLLADLRRGHRLAIDFGRHAVVILTQAPSTKRPQPTPAARGRGEGSPHPARSIERNSAMTTTKTKSAKKSKPTGERLRKEAQAEIAERIKALDAAQEHETPSAKEIANTSHPATASPTIAPVSTASTEATEGAKGKRGGPKAAPAATVAKVKEPKPREPAKEAKTKRLSALDAAASVLKSAREPMNTTELIEEMSKRKLWSSPNGATPEQTLYAAIVREIKAKGKTARFIKTERGRFASNGKAG